MTTGYSLQIIFLWFMMRMSEMKKIANPVFVHAVVWVMVGRCESRKGPPIQKKPNGPWPCGRKPYKNFTDQRKGLK